MDGARDLTLAIDAMGGDAGPQAVVDGVAYAVKRGLQPKVMFFGDEAQLKPLVAAHSDLAAATIRNSVRMSSAPRLWGSNTSISSAPVM